MKIRFKDDKTRKLFFDKIKASYSKLWKEIYQVLNVPKSTFERYKSGEFCLPEELFNKLSYTLDGTSSKIIFDNIEKLQDNYGQVIGGRIAYMRNIEDFNKGRKKGLVSIRKKRETDNISFSGLNLTPEICELIGAFIGDGMFNVYKNKLYQIEFACDKRYDLNYYNEVIIPAAKNIQDNISANIYNSYKRENALRIVFYSKKFFLFLRDFCGFTPGRKAHTIEIPSFLFNKETFRERVIRGIFDTDGGVFLDKRKMYKNTYPRIIFQTVSKPLFEQLKSTLSEKFTLYTRFNEKRQVYIIELYGINQVKRWMSTIGFSNQRHLNKVATVVQSARTRHW